MGKWVAGIIIGGLAVYAYQRAHQPEPEVLAQRYAQEQAPAPESLPAVEVETPTFHCDGRTHCSQMTSCEEATYFLEHCPGVKMDGDNGGRGDGIPCEQQWCVDQ